ncbi:MAG: hypothetical protein RR547_11145, partial [Raoultibacter sp.]
AVKKIVAITEDQVADLVLEMSSVPSVQQTILFLRAEWEKSYSWTSHLRDWNCPKKLWIGSNAIIQPSTAVGISFPSLS